MDLILNNAHQLCAILYLLVWVVTTVLIVKNFKHTHLALRMLFGAAFGLITAGFAVVMVVTLFVIFKVAFGAQRRL